MSYILKDSSQGQIAVKLTDAGRKKLSEGRLNIELFQLGDSEYCYNCYDTLPNLYAGINILQAEHNAQNLNPVPELNKGHVKYPIPINADSDSQTFGVAQANHNVEEVFNTATQRGFFTGATTACTCDVDTTLPYEITNWSANTTSAYTLNANWCFPASAMSGTQLVTLLSSSTYTDTGAFREAGGYTPVQGDILGIRFNFSSGGTGTCASVVCSAAGPTLFYQITDTVVTNTAQTGIWITATVDRNVPNLMQAGVSYGATPGTSQTNWNNIVSGITADTISNDGGFPRYCACVQVYPAVSGGTYSANSENPFLTWYSSDTPIPYWSPGSLQFENNCDVSVADVKVWNMNVPWTEQVAGVDSTNQGYESYNYYGSTGFCGTKEYLGYKSDSGQIDSGDVADFYNPNQISSSWYYDSYKHVRTVMPSQQKTIAIFNYTNQTISNFYGEKFALKKNGTTTTGVGEATNFKISFPWLMWHKKRVTGTGSGDEGTFGQCFYVDPQVNNVFPDAPNVMQSSVNDNMNEFPGLRYYYLWDDNQGPMMSSTGQTTVGPNPVGKVWPDLKIITIHDEELVAALSYKSNRSWTLPAPTVKKINAGTNCVGSASTIGVFTNPGSTMYLTYLMESNSGLTTGLHCNYYIPVEAPNGGVTQDLEIRFGQEFPYLRPWQAQPTNADIGQIDNDSQAAGINWGASSGGTGWQANKVWLLFQEVIGSDQPSPHLWKKTEVTQLIPSTYNTYGNQIHGSAMTQADTVFYLTAANIATATTYTLNDYIKVPSATTESTELQFGDEYFMYGALDSDIMATIYEMRYNVNIGNNQFVTSVNPTWPGASEDIKITEIGLFDNENGIPDLMAIAKFQSPVIRNSAQQFVLSLDF